MTLKEYLVLKYPGKEPGTYARGALRKIERAAETSYKSINKALRLEPIDDAKARARISAATGGLVSEPELAFPKTPPRAKRRRAAAA